MSLRNSGMSCLLISLFGVTLSIFATATALPGIQGQTISLDSTDQFKLVNVKAEKVTFKGRKALRVSDAAPAGTGDEEYETYVDLVPGEWTRIKIEVRGEKARLYVNGAEQPTLLVNDLKQGLSKGSVALWVGTGTVAHFSNLRISK